MNYLAHAHRFLARGDVAAEFIAGTAVPDWLNVVDRRVRCRERHAAAWVADESPSLAALARGVVQHHVDDAWFHGTRAFTELSLDFSRRLREFLGDTSDLRAGFLGHILVELLMDATLAEQEPERLDEYYATMRSVDAEWIGPAITQMCGQEVPDLGKWLQKFVELEFLRDYLDDGQLTFRLNQVLSRVRLDPLPGGLGQILPIMRASVAERLPELLPAS